VATDPSFDALCHQYRNVIELLDRFEAEVERLRKAIDYHDRFKAEVKQLARLRVSWEEQLLTRIEGYQPH
jgi:hypothetical protein